MIEEILNLPDVSFIDEMTLEDVQEQMIRDYEDKYAELTKKSYSLQRADPMALILFACSVQIYQGLMYVDRSGKMDLLKYTYGGYADHVAALKGISREPAKPARVTVKFTLSAVRPEPIAIPVGTRVTNGEVYFATEEYAEIPIGSTEVSLPCTCLTDGESGNGIMPGDINILTDPIAYVGKVANTTESSGGAEIESDEDLIERVYIAPSRYSVAGPEDAYKYWVKTFNANIADVYVDSDDPVDVIVEFIMENGELPSEEIIQAAQDYLQDEQIRPLTDRVTVKAPPTVDYDLELTYYINSSDSTSASTIQAKVNAAVEEFIVWQRSKIGRDINPSELIQRVVSAGAKRVEVVKPVFQKIAKDAVAKLGTKKVTYGGVEDD